MLKDIYAWHHRAQNVDDGLLMDRAVPGSDTKKKNWLQSAHHGWWENWWKWIFQLKNHGNSAVRWNFMLKSCWKLPKRAARKAIQPLELYIYIIYILVWAQLLISKTIQVYTHRKILSSKNVAQVTNDIMGMIENQQDMGKQSSIGWRYNNWWLSYAWKNRMVPNWWIYPWFPKTSGNLTWHFWFWKSFEWILREGYPTKPRA